MTKQTNTTKAIVKVYAHPEFKSLAVQESANKFSLSGDFRITIGDKYWDTHEFSYSVSERFLKYNGFILIGDL